MKKGLFSERLNLPSASAATPNLAVPLSSIGLYSNEALGEALRPISTTPKPNGTFTFSKSRLITFTAASNSRAVSGLRGPVEVCNPALPSRPTSLKNDNGPTCNLSVIGIVTSSLYFPATSVLVLPSSDLDRGCGEIQTG